MDSINYTTIDGDRWDKICYAFYGTLNPLKSLMDANPKVAYGESIPAGTNIIVPILDNTASNVITTNLPPWKR